MSVNRSGHDGHVRDMTPIDRLCDTYVKQACHLQPLLASYLGVAGYEDGVVDYSPDAVAERAALLCTLSREANALPARDHTDQVTQWALAERAEVMSGLFDAGQLTAPLNVIESPVQEMRDIFEVLPTDTEEDWWHAARRLRRYDQSVGSYMTALRYALERGNPPARRQVLAVMEQLDQVTHSSHGYFVRFTSRMAPGGKDPSTTLQREMAAGVEVAVAAFAALRSMLATEVLPRAVDSEGCGRELYRLHSRFFWGADVDLEDTYQWGLEELRDIERQMAQTASEICPGGSVADAVAALNKDPTRSVSDPDAFREWMQATAEETIVALSRVHFDIPPQVRTLECRFATSGSGVIYYTAPSEDFARPGRMWWAVPAGVDSYATWRERTNVYHEGVPGHHLQVAQALYQKGSLNRWRRLMSWVAGHGEGWALYAERLMFDLGYFDDPGDRLGMMATAALRAMRVVGDIGVHCKFPVPQELGHGTWDSDALLLWMKLHTRLSDHTARFEHRRYLGWPGQAPCYKVGERLWLDIRAEQQKLLGSAFELRSFHRDALNMGSIGLDVLRKALVNRPDVGKEGRTAR